MKGHETLLFFFIWGFFWELQRRQCGDVQTPASSHCSVSQDTASGLELQRESGIETGSVRMPIQYVFNIYISFNIFHVMKWHEFFIYNLFIHSYNDKKSVML